MKKRSKMVRTVLLCGALSLPLASCVATYGPPRPRSNCVWIPEHRTYVGVVIYGHWKYKDSLRALQGVDSPAIMTIAALR